VFILAGETCDAGCAGARPRLSTRTTRETDSWVPRRTRTRRIVCRLCKNPRLRKLFQTRWETIEQTLARGQVIDHCQGHSTKFVHVIDID
jgi:hypothetical protein